MTKKYTLTSLTEENRVSLFTESQSLFKSIIEEYRGEIFPDQIYTDSTICSDGCYIIEELSLSKLREFLSRTKEPYEIYSRYGKRMHLIEGQSGNERWLSC